MSKHHRASRRRTYGRRLHEMHERTDRSVGAVSWLDEPELQEGGQRWGVEPVGHEAGGDWLQVRGID